MALDITGNENYTSLEADEKTLVAAAVAAIKAAYTQAATSAKGNHDNIYMLLKEQNESQEGT